jgi:hypothetical protein
MLRVRLQLAQRSCAPMAYAAVTQQEARVVPRLLMISLRNLGQGVRGAPHPLDMDGG